MLYTLYFRDVKLDQIPKTPHNKPSVRLKDNGMAENKQRCTDHQLSALRAYKFELLIIGKQLTVNDSDIGYFKYLDVDICCRYF